MRQNRQNDFSTGSVYRHILALAVPLTLLLPHIAGLGVKGVFLAEPISNFIGGTASFTTMLVLVSRLIRKKKEIAEGS